MAQRLEFVDATASAAGEPPLPEVLAQMGEVGFGVLGRVATLSGTGDAQVPRAERERLARWRDRPAWTLLAAEDATAYAAVDTYGDAPLVRLRTSLADGSLVETVGVGSSGVLRSRVTDPFAVFTTMDSDGRSVLLRLDETPTMAVEAHRDHVARIARQRGSQPIEHRDRDRALEVWGRCAEHGTRVARRLGLTWRLVLAAFFLLLVLVVVLGGPVLGGGALIAALVAGALLLLPLRWSLRAVARARWWRPAYV